VSEVVFFFYEEEREYVSLMMQQINREMKERREMSSSWDDLEKRTRGSGTEMGTENEEDEGEGV
jgi:hypothetical protein